MIDAKYPTCNYIKSILSQNPIENNNAYFLLHALKVNSPCKYLDKILKKTSAITTPLANLVIASFLTI